MKLLTFLFMLLCSVGFSQTFNVTALVNDSTDQSPLISVTALLYQAKDTTQREGTVTDVTGKLLFSNVPPGQYLLKISYIGYASRSISVSVKNASVDLGTITMSAAATTLSDVVVKGTSIQVEQKGDTLQYNANAFKTSRDATAEDLITKMPGLTSDGTGLKAQGETVQQVLVDGKQFFGDDASIALKNLPAEIIEKIEVFDRLSDQAQLTGFDDGQTRKTVNIVTKKGRNNGEFGRIQAGIGEQGRYIGGGNINSFKGARRLSLIGLTNNINQQNFSNDDLLGVMGTASTSGGGNNRGGGQRGGGGNNGNSNNNFSVGQQSGISKTNSIGLNYMNEWSKKIVFSGSYFFNSSANERITDLSRLYITQRDSGLVYAEANRANSNNYNHRATFRIEYTIDTANSIIVTPRLSFQKNKSQSLLDGSYDGAESMLNRLIQNKNQSENAGYSFSNNVVFRHRFSKRGRSLSLGTNLDINNQDGNSALNSRNEDQSTSNFSTLDQKSKNFTDSYTLSPNVVYTEPVGKQGQMQLNYSPSYRESKTDKRTFDFATETNDYSNLDTLLSNKFNNRYVTHRGGLSYRYNNRTLNFNASVNYQQANLTSNQVFPRAFAVSRSFSNILPQISFNYKFSNTKNLRFFYRTSTNAPSISQLQNVVDNRNPLFLKTGNPGLSQDFSHNITIRFGKTSQATSNSFLILVSGGLTQNYITNTSIIAARDTIVNSIKLTRGTQLSFPVNINGYRTARTLVTYGFPVKLIKSNFNFNTGFTYNHIPALINGASNLANNYGISQGIVISSSISEKLDFTLSTTATYTIVTNSLQAQLNNNYYNQNTVIRLNWIFWKGFVLTSNVNHNLYRGLSAAFNQSIWLWSGGLGYKFLKDQSFEVKVNTFDVLNVNKSITRDVTETYIEDRQSNVLTRYFMLTLTYRLNHFKGR